MPPALHAAPSAASVTVTSPAPEGPTLNTHRSYCAGSARRPLLSVPPVTETLLRMRWFLSNGSVPSNTASLKTRSSANALAPSCASGTFSNDAVSVAAAAVSLVAARSAKSATSLPFASSRALSVPVAGRV